MCDPILGKKIKVETKQFMPDKVQAFAEGKDLGEAFPSRHYSQQIILFDDEKMTKALRRLAIQNGCIVTVFGGYTGEFASCLKRLGFSMIFSDPIEKWVLEAREKGFEAYQMAVEELPSELIVRSQLFASYECYFPFMNPETKIYTALRLLTSSYGIVFAESKMSRKQMMNEKEVKSVTQMGSTLNCLKDGYGLHTTRVDAGDVRLYHYLLEEEGRQRAKSDCIILKAIHDMVDNETELDGIASRRIAEAIGIEQDKVDLTYNRFTQTFQREMTLSFRSLAPLFADKVMLFDKTYRID